MHEIFSYILSCDLMDEYQDVKKSECNYGLRNEFLKIIKKLSFGIYII
jgi:hypothetical protein